jgi:FKBP-type peptidyl-prolyl cis-trans isomerase FkpA
MKKYLLLICLLIIGVSSCKKSGTSFNAAQQAVTDENLIKAYISANNITATRDPSGVYYQVITAGAGANPTAGSTVSVNYTGKLLDGSVFAPVSHLSAPLSGLIKGWQIGIPYTNAGGRILLIIPSGLGYGNTSPGAGIPANSVLVFTIDLLSFSN